MPGRIPTAGQVVEVRQRHWIVDEVARGGHHDTARVRLSCLDDDAAGEQLEVLWEFEVDAHIPMEKDSFAHRATDLDDPKSFAAYLNAMRWDCVTSTDRRLLQSPFRAGIDLKPYQLEPLRKALELPRVNLFIADDVGLGKTIEAGLIMQELMLRQRIDRVLVVAPPAVTLQWKEELEQRFGVSFAIYDREFVAARRRERGWAVNPWLTHPRFIVSTALLRGQRRRKARGGPRTAHLDLLLGALGKRAPKSLLILDEAHHAAPSTGSKYAIDSRTTRSIRQIASRFEHRVFLSATPHNGHSNSFSALLELLDPQRFTRGVPVEGVHQLRPVMVRRLKRDLRLQVGGLPERKLVDHTIRLDDDAPEIRLGNLLADYEEQYRESLKHLPEREQTARGLVCVNLHKRLLSSVYAFSRTLDAHARGARKLLETRPSQRVLPTDATTFDDEDLTPEEREQRLEEWIEDATMAPSRAALATLEKMQGIAAEHRHLPDGRVRELARWLRENLCPDGTWNHRRLVVFTEYDDTLGWLNRVLPALLATGDLEGRIARYHGGMSEVARDTLKSAFNRAPDRYPLRILLATDAAREGINLQAHCTDLFHFDLPWNPARIEQRNGRIDRTLQEAPVVRCHYFHLPDRPEDRVLTHVVKKVKIIADELGSLSQVISARLAARLDEGIRGLTPAEIDRIATPDDKAKKAAQELEGRGSDAEVLRGDLRELEGMLNRSSRTMGYDVEHLREAVDLGLQMATRRPDARTGGEGLHDIQPTTAPPSWRLPSLDDGTWDALLDPLLEPPPEDKPYKRMAVKPVAFEAAHKLDADTVQLHLGHPLVKRLLARFKAQGFARHELNQITAIASPDDRARRVLLFGHLVLFGPRASRLHEEVLAVAARWTDDGPPQRYARDAERTALTKFDALIGADPDGIRSPDVRGLLQLRAPRDLDALLAALKARAAEAETTALELLKKRADDEAEAMVTLIDRQEKAILRAIREGTELKERAKQQRLAFMDGNKEEIAQFERDLVHMSRRLDAISQERRDEPAAIRASYEVTLQRFTPIGLVYLWPEAV